jgi:SAM-dependent methyltransferase
MGKEIDRHYAKQAQIYSSSWASTMVEREIREKEIEALSKIIVSLKSKKSELDSFRILEIGCGNGYVAARLKAEFQGITIDAFDANSELIEIARKRNLDETTFGIGNFEDIDNLGIKLTKYDFIFSVRCIINIENDANRLNSISKIIDYLKPDGHLALLEGFTTGQENYNNLRVAFGYQSIPPAWHNYYLDLNKVCDKLNSKVKYVSQEVCLREFNLEIHHLSTHYLAMRVLLPALKNDGDFYKENRNDNLGLSLSRSLPKTSNFSPLQVHVWKK